MKRLSEFKNVPVTTSIIESLYPEYRSINHKVQQMENDGKIIRLKKGLFVVSPNESGELISMELIANHIYGPSYVSMETALRYYGLIPEAVYEFRSMTTKSSRTFQNSLGIFGYSHCSNEYFPIGIRQL